MLRYQALAELLSQCNRAPSKWASIDPVPLSFPFPIRHPRGTGIPTLREGRKVLEHTGLRSSAPEMPRCASSDSTCASRLCKEAHVESRRLIRGGRETLPSALPRLARAHAHETLP